MAKYSLKLMVLVLLFLVGCAENVSAPSPAETPSAIPPEATLPPATTPADSIIEFIENPDSLPLLEALYEGGYVIYVRHTATDRTQRDTDTSLGMCKQQRNLNELGREQAIAIWNSYKQLDLPVSRLISTHYCRTLETANLAFGPPEIITREELFTDVEAYLSDVPDAGTNSIIVAHIGTLRNTVGLPDTFEEGDSLVYQPLGDGNFEYVGRIALSDWAYWASDIK